MQIVYCSCTSTRRRRLQHSSVFHHTFYAAGPRRKTRVQRCELHELNTGHTSETNSHWSSQETIYKWSCERNHSTSFPKHSSKYTLSYLNAHSKTTSTSIREHFRMLTILESARHPSPWLCPVISFAHDMKRCTSMPLSMPYRCNEYVDDTENEKR